MFHFRAFYDFFGGADESFLGIKLQLKLGIFTGRFIIIFFIVRKLLSVRFVRPTGPISIGRVKTSASRSSTSGRRPTETSGVSSGRLKIDIFMN